MTWFILLILSIIIDILGILLCPILPLFSSKDGWLPKWLWWFQTPDFSLDGDGGWQKEHMQWRFNFPPAIATYIGRVGWLFRNHGYSFSWGVLGAPVDETTQFYVDGEINIKNRTNGIEGSFTIETETGYWQWKYIKRIGSSDMCVMLSFGWLLDAYVKNEELYKTQPKALFLFSPRISAFYPKQ